MRLNLVFKAHGRIVIDESPTAFAKHYILAPSQILAELRPQCNPASRADAVQRLRHNRAVPFFSNSLVSFQNLLVHSANNRVALRMQFIELFPIDRSAIHGSLLLSVDVLFFLLQRRFGLLQVGFQRLRFRHQFQNTILRLADLRLTEVDFVLKSPVLLIRFRLEHLVFQLGYFLILYLNIGFLLLTIFLVCNQGGSIGFEPADMGIKGFFDLGNVLWQRGNLALQFSNLVVKALQLDHQMKLWNHVALILTRAAGTLAFLPESAWARDALAAIAFCACQAKALERRTGSPVEDNTHGPLRCAYVSEIT